MRKCRQRARSSAGALFNRIGREQSPSGALQTTQMAVIPITVTISLILVLAFVAFFLREQGREGRGGAERDSLLPLAEETRRPAPPRVPPVAPDARKR